MKNLFEVDFVIFKNIKKILFNLFLNYIFATKYLKIRHKENIYILQMCKKCQKRIGHKNKNINLITIISSPRNNQY